MIDPRTVTWINKSNALCCLALSVYFIWSVDFGPFLYQDLHDISVSTTSSPGQTCHVHLKTEYHQCTGPQKQRKSFSSISSIHVCIVKYTPPLWCCSYLPSPRVPGPLDISLCSTPTSELSSCTVIRKIILSSIFSYKSIFY